MSDDAARVAAALIELDDKEPHWGASARALIAAAITAELHGEGEAKGNSNERRRSGRTGAPAARRPA